MFLIGPSTSTTATTNSNPTVTAVLPSVNSPVNVQTPPALPVTEHRRVFNYTARRGSFNPTMQPSRKRNSQKGKAKMQTCSLKFFCLGNVDDDEPPSTVSGKANLLNCGLGPASITCNVNASSVHEILMEKFPLLSSAGGYELLLFQRGENRGFHKLPTPYAPARLKDMAGQANIYICPLQNNLQMNECQEQTVQPTEVSCLFQPHDTVSFFQYKESKRNRLSII